MGISIFNSKLRQFIADHGVQGAARIAFVRAYRILRPLVAVPHPFDAEHGVDTSGLIHGRKLRSKHASTGHITAYWGTAPSLFRRLVAQWQATLPSGLSLDNHDFVDIGSGKGRVVMLASEFPFRQITGIELSIPLSQIAERNLSVWRAKQHACSRIDVVQADALAYLPPDEPVLVYLFNPFDRYLMEQFVDHLVACMANRTQSIDVLYVFPFHSACFADSPSIQLLWDAEFPFSEEDASVDIFESRQERCQLYRISPV